MPKILEIMQKKCFRKTLIEDIFAQGEAFNDDLYWTFKYLETVQFPNAFVRYVEDKKSEWEDGAILTSDQLCNSTETKFKHLFEAGKWKYASFSLPSETKVKDKEDAKFLALAAAVKEFAKNDTKSLESSSSSKNNWKYEAPPFSGPFEKQVNGKTFWWCTGKMENITRHCFVNTNLQNARKSLSLSQIPQLLQPQMVAMVPLSLNGSSSMETQLLL